VFIFRVPAELENSVLLKVLVASESSNVNIPPLVDDNKA